MKLPINKNKAYTLIDDEDFDKVKDYAYRIVSDGHVGRSVFRKGRNAALAYIHHDVFGRKEGLFVDHINRNPLDNRKSNLRFCTQSENQRNQGPSKRNTSGFKGVSYHTRQKSFIAAIRDGKKQIKIGSFKTAIKAAMAYNEKAKELHGEFAWLNPIP